MKIALDLDGVTIDTITAWLEQYHPNYTKDDMYKYNIWEIVEGCDKEQFFNEFGRLDPRGINLTDGAYHSILRIAEKHDVFFLTSKSERAQKWTEIVLRREGLGHIFLVNNWLEEKKKEEYDFDILLDDSPYNVSDRMIIFDQPWNRSLKGKRAISWSHFEHIIETL